MAWKCPDVKTDSQGINVDQENRSRYEESDGFPARYVELSWRS